MEINIPFRVYQLLLDAPTLYELAGINIPYRVDGKSLLALFEPGKKWRDHILLEGWPPRGVWAAVHTDRYVYGETEDDLSEFYDLQVDPYQMDNRINNPAYQDIIAKISCANNSWRKSPDFRRPAI